MFKQYYFQYLNTSTYLYFLQQTAGNTQKCGKNKLDKRTIFSF